MYMYVYVQFTIICKFFEKYFILCKVTKILHKNCVYQY
jgi:hypothetical protein